MVLPSGNTHSPALTHVILNGDDDDDDTLAASFHDDMLLAITRDDFGSRLYTAFSLTTITGYTGEHRLNHSSQRRDPTVSKIPLQSSSTDSLHLRYDWPV